MTPPDGTTPGLVRQQLLADADRRLPLGRDGTTLRRALREADAATRPRLIHAWADALGLLHAEGWGTEGAVAAATVTTRARVVFLPDLVWPLGSQIARRPVAAWLDWREAAAWLVEAGAVDDEARRRFTSVTPPWPDWPHLPPGPTALLGPPAELAALAADAAIACLPAGALADARGRDALLEHLLADEPMIVPVARAQWLRDLPLVPRARHPVAPTGRALPMTTRQAAALGLPDALQASAPATERPSADADPRRLIEDAALADTPASRDRLEAQALLAALANSGRQDQPLAETDARLAEVIDLARQAGARDLALRATQQRGLTRALSPDPAVAQAGHADLTEARRLAEASGDRPAAGHAAALEVLAGALVGPTPTAPAATDPNAPLAERAWQRLASDVAAAAEDEGAGGLDDLRRLLGLACALSDPFAVTACAEIATGWGVTHGREAHVERALNALLDAAVAPAARPPIAALTALLAARRGARLTGTERLTALAEPLLAPNAPPLGPLARRAAALGALAAAALGLDGLRRTLAERTPTAAATLLAHAALPVADARGWPSWWLVLVAESATAGDETGQRACREPLRARLARLPDDAWPAGLALALGRVCWATLDTDGARAALGQAAAHGERHVERAALSYLAELLERTRPGADETEAARRRLARLRAREVDPPMAPPADAEGRARAAHALIATAARQAAAAPGHGWRAAIEVLTGPIDGAPPSAAEAEHGLQLEQDVDGEWWLCVDLGAGARLLEPPRAAPSVIAAALSAIAPLLVPAGHAAAAAASDDPEDRWARAAHASLTSGQASFEEAVVTPFKRHDLTRRHVQRLLHLGLLETGGLYRAVAGRWGITEARYQKFMDFLRRANVALDFRPYRRGSPDAP